MKKYELYLINFFSNKDLILFFKTHNIEIIDEYEGYIY